MNDKKTICFVTPTKNTVGGIYTWYLNIKNLAQNDFNILEIDTSVANPTKKTFGLWNLFTKFLRIFYQRYLLKKYIKKTNLSVLHICTSGGFGSYRDYKLIKTAKRFNLKVILHLHFGKTKECIENNDLCSKWMKFNLLNSNAVISIDEMTSSFLSKESYSNVRYIPNPVSTFLENTYSPSGRRIILFVGYVIETKGIRELLNAFHLFSNNNNFDLLIVGPFEKKYIESLKKEKYHFERVVIKGKLTHDETMEILSNSRFLVLPSYTEGMPNVILEAMSYGVPIVATDVGNIRQMCGDKVSLAHPKDSKDLLNKMNEINNDDKLVFLSNYLFNRVRKLYSIEDVYRQLKDLWDNL